MTLPLAPHQALPSRFSLLSEFLEKASNAYCYGLTECTCQYCGLFKPSSDDLFLHTNFYSVHIQQNIVGLSKLCITKTGFHCKQNT